MNIQRKWPQILYTDSTIIKSNKGKIYVNPYALAHVKLFFI